MKSSGNIKSENTLKNPENYRSHHDNRDIGQNKEEDTSNHMYGELYEYLTMVQGSVYRMKKMPNKRLRT